MKFLADLRDGCAKLFIRTFMLLLALMVIAAVVLFFTAGR